MYSRSRLQRLEFDPFFLKLLCHNFQTSGDIPVFPRGSVNRYNLHPVSSFIHDRCHYRYQVDFLSRTLSVYQIPACFQTHVSPGKPGYTGPENPYGPAWSDPDTKAPCEKKTEPDPDAPVLTVPCIQRGGIPSVKLGARDQHMTELCLWRTPPD